MKAPFLVQLFSYNTLMTSMVFYADDSTLYCKSDWASDLGQKLELAFEIESDP